MGDLSKHFSLWEFACPGTLLNSTFVDSRLLLALEELRALLRQPIYILSGYRTLEHNTAIGGSTNSQHLLGKAADIIVPELNIMQIAEEAIKVEAFRLGGVGLYPLEKFVHLDVRGYMARWAVRNSKMMSIEEALPLYVS